MCVCVDAGASWKQTRRSFVFLSYPADSEGVDS